MFSKYSGVAYVPALWTRGLQYISIRPALSNWPAMGRICQHNAEGSQNSAANMSSAKGLSKAPPPPRARPLTPA